MIGWAILAAYILGAVVAFVISFRMLATSDLMGVESNSRTPGEAVGTVLLCGMLAFLIAPFWPVVALIFVTYRYAVAPILKGKK